MKYARGARRRTRPLARVPSAFQIEEWRPARKLSAMKRVIGRMELDHVAAEALGVERAQLGRILIGEPRRVEHRGRAPVAPNSRVPSAVRASPVRRHGTAAARGSLANRSTPTKGGD